MFGAKKILTQPGNFRAHLQRLRFLSVEVVGGGETGFDPQRIHVFFTLRREHSWQQIFQ